MAAGKIGQPVRAGAQLRRGFGWRACGRVSGTGFAAQLRLDKVQPVADGFGDMRAAQIGFSSQIGDGACDPKNAVIAPRRQAKPFGHLGQ